MSRCVQYLFSIITVFPFQIHLFLETMLFILSASNKLWSLFQIATVTGELRYVDAMRLLYTLEDASKGLGIHEFSSLLT